MAVPAQVPEFTLLIYGVMIAIVSILGGKVAEWVTLTHARVQILMSFISGFIISIAVGHLFPHSVTFMSGAQENSFEKASFWLLLGIVAMVFLLRMFHFHQHEFPTDCAEDRGAAREKSTPSPSINLWGVILGLGLCTLVEGMTLGAALKAELNSDRSLLWPGIGVFLAVIFHRPLDAYSIVSMMRTLGHGEGRRRLVNIIFALLCPLMPFDTNRMLCCRREKEQGG